ncbi:hypothetical protein EJ377_07780 [Chryseobacterium arthrosphaerae]|uniref:Peptidase M10 metallopeptidase domain-containing protein n=1 Tax=Chryseobacterium arthrosphaerae TaxID=651561 RepID=A0A432E0J4_9FLAO|nr:hypothetical protein EJ377_07780 [Chryseobacterium arthrosphaerae]
MYQTNGIIRYNGSSLSGYDIGGMGGSTGPGRDAVKNLAPHWPEHAYFNIYLVIGINGNKGYDGTLGWAGFPGNSDSSYESFMKIAAMGNPDTLAHEFGHAIGLDHIFAGTTTIRLLFSLQTAQIIQTVLAIMTKYVIQSLPLIFYTRALLPIQPSIRVQDCLTKAVSIM